MLIVWRGLKMGRTKEDIEDIFYALVRTKGELFIDDMHKKRMSELMERYPEHYKDMSVEELAVAKKKEWEIVDEHFSEIYEYPYEIVSTGERTTGDGIPQSTIEIMKNHLVELFYIPFDSIEIKYQEEQLKPEDIFDVVYEMVAMLVEHIKDAGDYQDFFNSGINKHRVEPSVRTKAKELIKLLDENGTSCIKGDKLYEALEDLRDNTSSYLSPSPSLLTADLKKDYQASLSSYLNKHLLNKMAAIHDFITELTNDTQRAYSVKTNRAKH